jgi:energy-converting hydrogenase B subunit J
MIVYAGPLILGFLLGFVLGTRIRINSESGLKFDPSVYLIFIIVAIIVAYLLGPFPYYKDLPLANGFIAAAIGIIMGKLLFGRDRISQKVED